MSGRVATVRAAAGISLVELVVALAIGGVLLAGLTSALVMTTRVLPHPDDPLAATIAAGRFLSELAGELETAVHVTEHTQTSIAFAVADRDGDGKLERIRYAWSGDPGDPVTRQLNDAAAYPVVEATYGLAFTYDYKNVTETYRGVGVEPAADELLLDIGVHDHWHDLEIKTDEWVGQHLAPSIPPTAMAWRPTRVQIRAKNGGLLSGASRVQLRPVDANLKPTTTILEERNLSFSLLGLLYSWQEFGFGSVAGLAPSDALALVVRHDSGAGSMVEHDSHNGAGLLTTNDTGVSWSYESGKRLRCRLYGRVSTPGPDQFWHDRHLHRVGIQLALGADEARVMTTTIPTHNLPRLRVGHWASEFDADPTLGDGNGDGASDWSMATGSFPANHIVAGAWQAASAAELRSRPELSITTPAMVRARMRDRVANGNASPAEFTIAVDRDSSAVALIRATLTRESNGQQTFRLLQHTGASTTATLMIRTGIGGGLVDVRLIVDPHADSVAVFLDSVDRGTFGYQRIPASTTAQRDLRLRSPGGDAEFDRIELIVAEGTP